MRRFTIVLLALVTVAAPMIAFGEGKPRALPLEPIKDFEIVPKGEKIHHTFEIKNDGDAPLELTDVKPACGCTVVEFDQFIQPGAVGRVKTTVETDNFDGPIAKTIAVFTNDPENPKIQLVVKAEVKPYLSVFPGYARYSYVQGEEIGVISQLLWAEDGQDLEILKVKSPYPHMKVVHHVATEQERKGELPGKQWTFELHLDPYSPIGALRDYVEVITDHSQQKTVRIPLSGFVRPRQHVTPFELDLGVVDGEALPIKRVLAFTNFIKEGIEITEIDTGFKAIAIEADMVGQMDGHRFELMLTVDPAMPKGEFEGTIKLHITDEKNPVVKIPVKGKVI